MNLLLEICEFIDQKYISEGTRTFIHSQTLFMQFGDSDNYKTALKHLRYSDVIVPCREYYSRDEFCNYPLAFIGEFDVYLKPLNELLYLMRGW